MKTRQEIEAILRRDNPTTTDDKGNRYGAGEPIYEAAISRWADAMEASQILPGSTEATPRQIRLALVRNGIPPSNIAASLADNEEASIEWEYALAIRRDHPLVESLGTSLGLTSQQIDDIFRQAITI